MLHHPPGAVGAGLYLHTLQAPLHLHVLLDQPHLLLLLLAVVLDVLPQAAGIGVPLQTTDHLALVRLLNTVGQHLTTL